MGPSPNPPSSFSFFYFLYILNITTIANAKYKENILLYKTIPRSLRMIRIEASYECSKMVASDPCLILLNPNKILVWKNYGKLFISKDGEFSALLNHTKIVKNS
jgi:hypothetical protein